MGYQKRADFNKRRLLKCLEKDGKWSKIIEYCNQNALECKSRRKLEDGLDVHLRSDSVHIYYKGGRILEIKADVLNIDPSYFYKRKEYDGIPRTHLELLRDKKWDELKQRNANYKDWTPEKAESVFEYLKNKRNELFGLGLNPSNKELRNAYIKSAMQPENYFRKAMTVMDDWSDALKEVTTHQERLLQQKISVVNKDIKESDFLVIDIEFSVSSARDCPFRSEDKKYQTHPRFDIIAVQPKKNFRLAVIELKRGLGAVGITDDDTFDEETKSGVKDHVCKFDATVGNEKGYKCFVSEMQGVLNMKAHLGILPHELSKIKIPLEKPEFYLAYAGESMPRFKTACKRADLKCICIKDEEYPLLKNNED